MVSENKIGCVIMLCNIIENGKVRCFDYLSNRNTEIIENHEDSIEISKVKTINNYEYTHVHYS